MAKKDEEGFFTKMFKNEILNSLGKYIKTSIDSGMNVVEKNVQKRVDRIMKKIYFSLTMLAGIIFLMVGFAIFVEQYVSFPKGSGFILIGAIIAIGAFVIKSLSMD